ncbi:hypothetical protein CCACVL1_09312 [Corchorus capsularis]|uniref:Uncharacterized protein n=1 Tax=Corchorus capsularis TaxID=210143 RepID=A0A1R3IWS9_COCAP|nr:hypothetical protein CCACVL1_09312 [Corchorus capsularis]
MATGWGEADFCFPHLDPMILASNPASALSPDRSLENKINLAFDDGKKKNPMHPTRPDYTILQSQQMIKSQI